MRQFMKRVNMRFAWSAGREHASSQSGFTLVELCVVVAITCILIALLFPVYGMVRDQAQGVQCISNLRKFAAGIPLYMADHDGVMYPTCTHGSWYWLGDEEVIGARPFTAYEGASFAPYVDYAYGMPQLSKTKKGLLYCPSISVKYPGPLTNANLYNAMPNGCLGYAMNLNVFIGNARLSDFGPNLSKKLILADGTSVGAMQAGYNFPFGPGAARHNNKVHGLFMDFHVGSLTVDEVSNKGAGEQPFAGLISKER